MVPTPSHKRQFPSKLPTPGDLSRIFKKPRLDQPELLETFRPTNFSGASPVPPLLVDVPPVFHNVPRNAVPVLELPYQVSDFFTDFQALQNENKREQFSASIRSYPPPRAPSLFLDDSAMQPGVMVPFVFPPIPTIQYDPYMNIPESKKNNADPGKPLEVYPTIAPLPFPPPNYMPYPMMSEKAPPTPHDVFSKLIDALQHLPRVDMVVASAAGSIYDLHAEAGASGLNATKLHEMMRLGQLAESDPEGYDDKSDASDSLDVLDSSYRRFMDYYDNIDTSSEHDPHAQEFSKNTVVLNSIMRNRYMDVDVPAADSQEVLLAKLNPLPLAFSFHSTEDDNPCEIGPLEFERPGEIVDASGHNKETRLANLVSNYENLEDHFEDNKDEIFYERKRQLLERLHSLRTSKVAFDGNQNDIHDEELRRYATQRQTQKDEQLVTLKLSLNYERLKNVLNFYQTSSRLYKTMNAVVINKLQKMKNFLAYQKQVLDDHSTMEGSPNENDLLNIRNRDISKFYEGFVEQDYSNEIKEIFRAAIAKDDSPDKDDPYQFDPSLFRLVYEGHEHQANVHDFMPLVTRDEFRLVTGEAPSKAGPSKDLASKTKGARHQIFQSPLYDRVTSGSDTNATDSGVIMKRRPGRRAAPKPTYGEEVAKNSNDSALVAKIMKQFIGPGAASAQELTEDLGLIGIQTKWPIK